MQIFKLVSFLKNKKFLKEIFYVYIQQTVKVYHKCNLYLNPEIDFARRNIAKLYSFERTNLKLFPPLHIKQSSNFWPISIHNTGKYSISISKETIQPREFAILFFHAIPG